MIKVYLFLTRVLKHLGCPHGCADGQRGPPADFLRSQGQNILSKLHRASPRQFSRFLREMVCNQTISDVLDFFHAYVGFCVDPSSLLSPLSKWVLLVKVVKPFFLMCVQLPQYPQFENCILGRHVCK